MIRRFDGKVKYTIMSQFLICKTKKPLNYGVPLREVKSNQDLYTKVVDKYMKSAKPDDIWVVEEMPDMADPLEKNIPIIDEICRQSELMIFWYGSAFQDLDRLDSRQALLAYLKANIANPCLEVYLYVKNQSA